jgi:hypothetical protein
MSIAACRRCGEGFDRKSGPFGDRAHGLFAVVADPPAIRKTWSVEEPYLPN